MQLMRQRACLPLLGGVLRVALLDQELPQQPLGDLRKRNPIL